MHLVKAQEDHSSNPIITETTATANIAMTMTQMLLTSLVLHVFLRKLVTLFFPM